MRWAGQSKLFPLCIAADDNLYRLLNCNLTEKQNRVNKEVRTRKKKKRGEKKIRKAQIKFESELPADRIPFAMPVVKIEPASQPVVNNIISRQKEVFNDKRANIETFLNTL